MIIGLEGVSCVGKTTLAKRLARWLGAGVVDCFYHAAPDRSWLPPLAARDGFAQLDALAALMRVEALRRAHAVAVVSTGRDVILDRTVDTLLAHTHAIGRLTGFDCDGAARALVGAHPAVMPDLTLLLHATPAELSTRARRRAGLPPILYDPQFTHHFMNHFDRPLTPVCVRLNTTDSVGDLLTRAIDAITAHHTSGTPARAA